MLMLEYVEKEKKGAGDQMGVGYYPLLVLCRDTTVVSRHEGHCMHGRRACVHNQGPLRARSGMPGEACRNRHPWVLCRDKVGSPYVATRVFSVATEFWAAEAFGVVTQFWCRDSKDVRP